jgi:hypothetical protein
MVLAFEIGWATQMKYYLEHLKLKAEHYLMENLKAEHYLMENLKAEH